jgi:hypothetical protein
MTKEQRISAIVFALGFALMLLYPPWRIPLKSGPATIYAPFISAPRVQDGTRQVRNEEYHKTLRALADRFDIAQPDSWRYSPEIDTSPAAELVRADLYNDNDREFVRERERLKREGRIPPPFVDIPNVVVASHIDYVRLCHQSAILIALALGVHLIIGFSRRHPE